MIESGEIYVHKSVKTSIGNISELLRTNRNEIVSIKPEGRYCKNVVWTFGLSSGDSVLIPIDIFLSHIKAKKVAEDKKSVQ